jgi:hypothetical protein
MPKAHRYKLQTEYRVINCLLPTKELEQVLLLIEITVNRHSKKILLSKVTLKASTSDQVVISCKCKGFCNTKRCRCFEEQKRYLVYCHSSDDDHD